MSSVGDYLALTKPRILPLVLFSGLPVLILAAGGWPIPTVTGATLLGTVLCASAANALNSYLERDLDARMERTRERPLPAGRLRPQRALAFGLGLGALGASTLWLQVGTAAALVALSAILIYVFAYTLWLKPRTPFAVIVGGISGAIAPLIADAAVDGQIGAAGWLLFAIIFAWQPPHFYAIALFRRSDYARAGFPMLADRIGERATRDRIVAWSIVLLPITLLPVVFLPLGWIYGVATLGLGLALLWRGLQLRVRPSAPAARSFFFMSLVHLMGLFSAMLCDIAVGSLL